MPARLPVFRPNEKRDMQVETRRAEHARAWAACTERITRFVSDEIHKPGMRLIEEIASGAKRGPGEVIEQVVVVARRHKDEVDAIAPVRELARRLGYALTPASAEDDGEVDITGAAAVAGREFGESVAALLDAARDGLRNPVKRDKARRETHEAIAALYAALHEVDEHYAPAAGPRRVETGR